MPVRPGFKRCRSCSLELPLSDFFERPDSRDGHYGSCKCCMLAHKRELYRQGKG
jgi:hypothetical protein